MQVKTENDLSSYLLNNGMLDYLVNRSNSGQKNWFGFPEQRITGITLAHDIAKFHADKLTPEECVDYAQRVNNAIYEKIIKSQQ
jgi:hypothetical protein